MVRWSEGRRLRTGIAALGIVAAGWATTVSAKSCDDITRVVAPEPGVAELLRQACHRSPTVASLIETIERSPWRVYLHEGPCPQKGVLACLLHSVGHVEGEPYLRILLSEAGYPSDTVAIRIAHELQHAAEVIAAGSAQDADDLRQLFKQIGFERFRTRSGTVYETSAALETEEQVQRELEEAAPFHSGGP